MQHRIAQHIDRDRRVLSRNIDVVDRAFERCVSIDVATMGLHFGRNFAAIASLGSLE